MNKVTYNRPKFKTVILDANSLFLPFQFGINLTENLSVLLGHDVRIIVPSSVIFELENLPEEDWKVKAALKLANTFEIVQVGGRGDDAVFDFAKRSGFPVVTQDKVLKRRLMKEGLRVITLREKSYFIFE